MFKEIHFSFDNLGKEFASRLKSNVAYDNNKRCKCYLSTYNRASDVCICMYVSHVLDRKLLERLMSPSPKSQVMFASAFS